MKKNLFGFGLTCAALTCWATMAGAANPDPKEFVPANQMATFQPQAASLAQAIARAIAQAEAATVGQTAAQRTAAIQAAIQNAIIPTGYDPRVVLAALRAVDFCPTGTGDYTGNPVAVPCGSLKDTLSAEAQAAIQNVEATVVALIDNSPTPAALGGAGPAAFGAPGAPGGGGGYIQSL